jgi:hypothetical protein
LDKYKKNIIIIMAATVHVGINTNTRYTNNTGTNVRIIIYYLKVSDTTLNNPFYISYGDSDQLAGSGRPSKLELTYSGQNYFNINGDNFYNWPTTAVTGSGTGLLVDGAIYTTTVNSNEDKKPRPSGTGGVGNPYAIGDIISIGEANDGGANWAPATAKVTDMQGNGTIRIPFSESSGFAIGANLASSGYSHYTSTQSYKSMTAPAPLQNAAPFGGDGRALESGPSNLSYVAPTECFISNGQSFELHRAGAASTQMQYNFVAIPEGG